MNDDSIKRPDSTNATEPPPTNADLLLEFIRQNAAACPVCGYNLHRLTHDICPECGQRFALKIGAAEPRFGLFLTFLAPLLMSAGIGLLLLVVIAFEGPPPLRYWGVYLVELWSLCNTVTVFWMYRRKSWFFRRQRQTQRMLVLLAWAVNVLVYFVSFLLGT